MVRKLLITYGIITLLTLIFQVWVRSGVCGDACGIAYLKAFVWAVIWPASWIAYLWGYV
jgi:hypothetical protein